MIKKSGATRPERYKVDFPVFLQWQDRAGIPHRLTAQCVDLSAAGAQVEAKEQLPAQTMVLLTSECFGRMGNATVRYCRRTAMKFKIGIHFSAQLQLGDPKRQEILATVLRKLPAQES
jgi:hypothetical protein